MNQIVLTLILLVPAADSDAVSSQQLKDAVQRSVPFLETRGQEWIDEKKCISCHQVPFMLWSLREAQQHGLTVDEAKLNKTFDWALDLKHWAAEVDETKFDEQAMAEKNIDSLYQLLLAADYADKPDPPAWTAAYQAHLRKWQQPDGSWKACGQLPTQKRPASESTEVTSMFSLLALAREGAADESLRATIQRTREFIEKAPPGESSEWWAVRLLFERRFGEKDQAEKLLGELLNHQHGDGGWGWLIDEESDALATGVVLYALSREHSEQTAAAIGRAHRFLVRTQQTDGSWIVKSTQRRHKDAVKPTSTYWGTAWAAIGILKTLPDQSAP
jgi:hypothetical protein